MHYNVLVIHVSKPPLCTHQSCSVAHTPPRTTSVLRSADVDRFFALIIPNFNVFICQSVSVSSPLGVTEVRLLISWTPTVKPSTV